MCPNTIASSPQLLQDILSLIQNIIPVIYSKLSKNKCVLLLPLLHVCQDEVT